MVSPQTQDLKHSPRDDAITWIARNSGAMVYIAGPMAGMPDHGYPLFHRAEERLWQLDLVPLSPASGAPPQWVIDRTLEENGGTWASSKLYRTMIQKGSVLVLMSKAMFLLPGWSSSTGAKHEDRIARMAGIPTFEGDWLVGMRHE